MNRYVALGCLGLGLMVSPLLGGTGNSAVPTTKIAHALRYLYDHRPTMSLRAIGATPEVDLHHDNVGKIRDAATAVFGTAPGAGRT